MTCTTIAPALPDLDAPAAAQRDECAFPGETADEGLCREIPVATIAETCGSGHMEMLRCCTGHAAETIAVIGSFIGEPDSPGLLTCPQCRFGDAPSVTALSVSLTWDDLRPVEVIQ